MSGSLVVSTDVLHVYQRRFDVDALHEALSRCHVYLITRRPATRIVAKTLRERKKGVRFSIAAKAEIGGDWLQIKSGLSGVRNFKVYECQQYFSCDDTGGLMHGDAWALASFCTDAAAMVASQEILYVGQAFGRLTQRHAGNRLTVHATLQQIYEDHAGEDWDIFVAPIYAQSTMFNSLDHIDDLESETRHRLP